MKKLLIIFMIVLGVSACAPSKAEKAATARKAEASKKKALAKKDLLLAQKLYDGITKTCYKMNQAIWAKSFGAVQGESFDDLKAQHSALEDQYDLITTTLSANTPPSYQADQYATMLNDMEYVQNHLDELTNDMEVLANDKANPQNETIAGPGSPTYGQMQKTDEQTAQDLYNNMSSKAGEVDSIWLKLDLPCFLEGRAKIPLRPGTKKK